MRSKKVTRHYCDHCNRGSFKKPSMARHEASCYHNRQRVCWRCKSRPEYAITEERGKELFAIAEAGKKIETKGGECPDCLMAYCVQRFPKVPDPFETLLYYEREQYKKDVLDWDKEHTGWWPNPIMENP